MKPNEIKALLARREIKLTDIAQATGISRVRLSQAVNYLRENSDARAAIAGYLKMPVEKVFSKKIEIAPAKFRQRAA